MDIVIVRLHAVTGHRDDDHVCVRGEDSRDALELVPRAVAVFREQHTCEGVAVCVCGSRIAEDGSEQQRI